MTPERPRVSGVSAPRSAPRRVRATPLFTVVMRAGAPAQEAEAFHPFELRAERVRDAVLEPADHPGAFAEKHNALLPRLAQKQAMPCASQIASMFAVLPPLTQIAS